MPWTGQISLSEPSHLLVNKKLELSGIVQGVGFRPFVYQLALRCGLKGYVQNSSKGVHIEIEGALKEVGTFMEALSLELPPLARIDSTAVSYTHLTLPTKVSV